MFGINLNPFRSPTKNASMVTTTQEETMYDAIGKPSKDYESELDTYLKGQKQMGLIRSILPTTLYGALFGFAVSIRPSRLEGRHIGRSRIIGAYTGACAAGAFVCNVGHQLLLVYTSYNDQWYYPMISGTAGSATVFGLLMTMASPMYVAVSGGIIGASYMVITYAKKYYQEITMKNFFIAQKIQEVPVHKLSPELQPAYRAFLYEFRPPEEFALERRRMAVLGKADDDARFDAETALKYVELEFWDWFVFPDWWPMKASTLSDDQLYIRERRQVEKTEDIFSQIRHDQRNFTKFVRMDPRDS